MADDTYTTVQQSTLSHAAAERTELRSQVETLTKEVDHWKTTIGFDTPEQAIAAVNARFEKELPQSLGKALWRIENKENQELRSRIAELEAALGALLIVCPEEGDLRIMMISLSGQAMTNANLIYVAAYGQRLADARKALEAEQDVNFGRTRMTEPIVITETRVEVLTKRIAELTERIAELTDALEEIESGIGCRQTWTGCDKHCVAIARKALGGK